MGLRFHRKLKARQGNMLNQIHTAPHFAIQKLQPLQILSRTLTTHKYLGKVRNTKLAARTEIWAYLALELAIWTHIDKWNGGQGSVLELVLDLVVELLRPGRWTRLSSGCTGALQHTRLPLPPTHSIHYAHALGKAVSEPAEANQGNSGACITQGLLAESMAPLSSISWELSCIASLLFSLHQWLPISPTKACQEA